MIRLRFAMLILLLLVLYSALQVVLVRDANRRLFTQIDQARNEYDILRLHGVQLAIEKSVYTAKGRVDAKAHSELDMHSPDYENIVYIKQ